MNQIFQIFLIGFGATLVMTGVVFGLHGKSVSALDMLRALGSIFTRRLDYALPIGAAVHCIVGCACAFFYIGTWNLFPFAGIVQLTTLGVLVGFGHGLLVSLLLMTAVSEHHQLARFRKAGFGIALAYLTAHLAYGFTIGLGAAVYNPKLHSLDRFALSSTYAITPK